MAPERSRKTVLRSLRISREMDEILQKEASSRGVSFNALASSIFKKFAEWDRYAERYGFVTITRDGFRAIHEAIDDETLVNLMKDIGSRNPREASLFWFKRLDLETFLAWLSLHCKYGKIAECEIDALGRRYSITLHHALGKKYSLALGSWCDRALRTIAHVSPKLELSENSVMITFETSPPASPDRK